MATLYPNVSCNPNQRSKDNYNFYHSQLCIHIVCAFGMLLQKWGLLQIAMPRNLSLKKINAIINALAKLHNFCMEESEILEDVPQALARDTNHVMNNHNGYVKLSYDGHDTTVTLDLMHGGHHFMDVPWDFLCNHQLNNPTEMLPRTTLHNFIANRH